MRHNEDQPVPASHNINAQSPYDMAAGEYHEADSQEEVKVPKYDFERMLQEALEKEDS